MQYDLAFTYYDIQIRIIFEFETVINNKICFYQQKEKRYYI